MCILLLRCSGMKCKIQTKKKICPKFYKRVRYERGNDREVFTTSGTYPWSFVTQIFHKGQPSHGGDRKTFEVMTST